MAHGVQGHRRAARWRLDSGGNRKCDMLLVYLTRALALTPVVTGTVINQMTQKSLQLVVLLQIIKKKHGS